MEYNTGNVIDPMHGDDPLQNIKILVFQGTVNLAQTDVIIDYLEAVMLKPLYEFFHPNAPLNVAYLFSS